MTTPATSAPLTASLFLAYRYDMYSPVSVEINRPSETSTKKIFIGNGDRFASVFLAFSLCPSSAGLLSSFSTAFFFGGGTVNVWFLCICENCWTQRGGI